MVYFDWEGKNTQLKWFIDDWKCKPLNRFSMLNSFYEKWRKKNAEPFIKPFEKHVFLFAVSAYQRHTFNADLRFTPKQHLSPAIQIRQEIK